MGLLNRDCGVQQPCSSQELRLTHRVKGGWDGMMRLMWPGQVGVSGNMKNQG